MHAIAVEIKCNAYVMINKIKNNTEKVSTIWLCEKLASNNLWCKWFRSALKGDSLLKIRIEKTLNVSNIGMISKASVIKVAPPDPVIIWLILFVEEMFFIKTIHSVANENPKIKEPVSPMNILAGAILNFRNPRTAPSKVMLIIASL